MAIEQDTEMQVFRYGGLAPAVEPKYTWVFQPQGVVDAAVHTHTPEELAALHWEPAWNTSLRDFVDFDPADFHKGLHEHLLAQHQGMGDDEHMIANHVMLGSGVEIHLEAHGLAPRRR